MHDAAAIHVDAAVAAVAACGDAVGLHAVGRNLGAVAHIDADIAAETTIATAALVAALAAVAAPGHQVNAGQVIALGLDGRTLV